MSQGDYSGIIGLGVSIGITLSLAGAQPAQGANGASGGRGGVTLEEMEQLYDAQFTPAQARQSSSWSDYFQVRPPDGAGGVVLPGRAGK